MNIPKLQAPYSKLNNLLYISYLPKVINAAVAIKLFDVLSTPDEATSSTKGRTLESIVKELDTPLAVTRALLHVLEKIELVRITEDTYHLTPLAEDYLVSSSEANQVKALQEFSGSNGPFDQLLPVLQGDTPEFNQHMWNSKESALSMEQGMKAGGLQGAVKFVKSLPQFASCTKLCDLAGNIGYYSYAFLQENKHLQAHVYDLPEVCKNAKELKQDEPDFDRVTYHALDMKTDEDFGDGYDFVYVSHYMYGYAVNGELVDFLTRIYKAMKPGGIFVSNHVCDISINPGSDLTLALVELQTQILGYPTHQISEDVLRDALTKAGFSDFTVQMPDGSYAYPTMLMAAVKI